ncbi:MULTISPECIES: transposase [unclassified Microcoleus]
MNPYYISYCLRRSRRLPSNWTKREILDGIFYQLKNGCNWQDLPA